MENKGFWQNFQNDSENKGKIDTTEQYKAETDRILQAYRKKTSPDGETIEKATQTDSSEAPQAAGAEGPGQKETGEAVHEMLVQMQELRTEVKELRNQLEENTFDIYAVPRSRNTAAIPRLLMTNGIGMSPEDTAILQAAGMQASMTQELQAMPVTTGIQTMMPAGQMVAAAVEPAAETATGQPEEKEPQKKKFAWVGEAVFYAVLILLIVGAFLIKSNSGGRPITIGGYAAFTVLTSSMESEIPQGSLVITKAVDPGTLQVGDDITFMVNETTSVTHRIIGITENYEGTGARGFETKGVMNAQPDKEMVAAANVVGKVVFHNKLIGQIGTFLNKNWPFLLFFAVVVFGLMAYLKWNFKDDLEEEEEETEKPKKRKKEKKLKAKKSKDTKTKKQKKKPKEEVSEETEASTQAEA